MKTMLTYIFKISIIFILTLLTQIGGILYLLTEIVFRKKRNYYRIKKISVFLMSYLVFTFWILPFIAPVFGREKIKESSFIEAHSWFTKLCNRNYVTKDLHVALHEISKNLQKRSPNSKLVYLDANFPFINGFPLLPHLSHNDGKKIDLAFMYMDLTMKITNKKPAILGYGSFVHPSSPQADQNNICKQKGYWQYDIAKYLTFGMTNNSLIFSEKATKDLLLTIVAQPEIKKIFIEPHLKSQLNISHQKIRFHGCHSVRHDDHIHIQL